MMPLINERGMVETVPGTLSVVRGEHPAYRAQIALALPVQTWLYAPSEGHSLDQYKNEKASQGNVTAYEKALRLYLQPYGPTVTDRLIGRGHAAYQVLVSKETLKNG